MNSIKRIISRINKKQFRDSNDNESENEAWDLNESTFYTQTEERVIWDVSNVNYIVYF
jgi:hypothetical protein